MNPKTLTAAIAAAFALPTTSQATVAADGLKVKTNDGHVGTRRAHQLGYIGTDKPVRTAPAYSHLPVKELGASSKATQTDTAAGVATQ